MVSLFFTLLDSSLVLAGHGYDFRGSAGGESGGADDGGGLSITWIVLVVALAVGTVLVLSWMNRSEPDGAVKGSHAPSVKTAAPLAFIVAVIAAPLVIWTASSGGDDDRPLMVERFTSVTTGAPELLISLGEDVANTLEQTGGNRTVRILCDGRDGKQVLAGEQKWPFIRERGYDFAHVHQAATPEQVQRADRCRVLGTRTSLQAAVEGKLKD